MSARTDHDIRALLDEVVTTGTLPDLNKWASKLGAPLPVSTRPPYRSHTYLQRLDILRLAQAFRALGAGNYQLLFDRVETVEVMSYHFNKLKESITEYRQNRNESALDQLQQRIERLLDVPVVPSLYRYYAMVTEIAGRLSKDVSLHIHGSSTAALPRARLYALHDALVHMLRNALDHGIESRDERLAHGKPVAGIIDIECLVRGGGVTLILRDDGRGIDTVRLKQKAVENGLMSAEEAERMSENDARQLIFRPRLSTAATVTDISGRGVGMDAVREKLAEIGARIEVDSALGVGTRFTIHVSTLGGEQHS